MKKGLVILVILSTILLASIVLAGSFFSDWVTGQQIRRPSTSCQFLDTKHNLDLINIPIDKGCSKKLPANYKPVAYQLTYRDHLYDDPTCQYNNAIFTTEAHELMQSYTYFGRPTIPRFYEFLEGMTPENKSAAPCSPAKGIYYTTRSTFFDGVLCCK